MMVTLFLFSDDTGTIPKCYKEPGSGCHLELSDVILSPVRQ